jgi:hypothetical protein
MGRLLQNDSMEDTDLQTQMGRMIQGIMLVVVLAANNAGQMPSNAMFLQPA